MGKIIWMGGPKYGIAGMHWPAFSGRHALAGIQLYCPVGTRIVACGVDDVDGWAEGVLPAMDTGGMMNGITCSAWHEWHGKRNGKE
jgi:hypothetical protein